MASEKITAIIDSVKELSVLELKELIDAYCEEFGVSAVAAGSDLLFSALLLPLLLVLLLPLRKRRPSSTSSWLRLALPRCRSSSWSRRSPVWA